MNRRYFLKAGLLVPAVAILAPAIFNIVSAKNIMPIRKVSVPYGVSGISIWVDMNNKTGKSDGSFEHPFLNVPDAMNHVDDKGGVVYIRAGTYNNVVSVANYSFIGV